MDQIKGEPAQEQLAAEAWAGPAALAGGFGDLPGIVGSNGLYLHLSV